MELTKIDYKEVNAKLYHSDNVTGMYESLEPESIDLTVTSIPFGSLFSYSGRGEDIGNNSDGVEMLETQFAVHLRFHIESLFRAMKPGCNVCIHIQQLLSYKNEHGFMGRRDFRGALVEMMTKGGFNWIGEVVIPKNPQIIAQRLKLHSLMFVTGKRNARQLAPAVNDYVMIFQKPGQAEKLKAIEEDTYKQKFHSDDDMFGIDCEIDIAEKSDNGVTKENWINWASGLWQNENKELRHGAVTELGLSAVHKENFQLEGYKEAFETAVKFDWLATGYWNDIKETDVLDAFKAARDDKDEKHVCPLQLEVIRRLIKLYSAQGETILDPFMGIGSTAWVALEQGRNAVGYELKDSYYQISVKNLNKLTGILNTRELNLFSEVEL